MVSIDRRFITYLCTYDLYGPVRNAFDAGSIHNEGKWKGGGGVEPWKSRLFWPLCNGIEPIGECQLRPGWLGHSSPASQAGRRVRPAL
jgi:hypothetical protein